MKNILQQFVILFLFMIVIPFPIACSKKSSDPTPPTSEFFIRFKVDGIQKEFKANTRATISDVSTVNTPIILGAFSGLQTNATNTTANLMSVSVRDPLTMAIKKVYSSTSPGAIYQVALLYWDENGDPYSSEFLSTPSSSDAMLTLSEITENYVSGSFNGKVALSGASLNTHLITEGTFKLKRY